jgi:GMP synthase (glutamine-hydrolysing)
MSRESKSLRILVVEGNTNNAILRMASVGSPPYAPFYAALLERIMPGVVCTCVHPADDGPDCLPAGDTLTAYDGAVWTGSALSVYEDVPAVHHQLELAQRVLAAKVPVFGSCWGLQVFSTVLGGRVHKNPRGWEVGYARDIELTPQGCEHLMYAGKSSPFGAFAVHQDEVAEAAPGGVILARNAMSAVQAWAWEESGASFWGVQYHPEFDHQLMAWTFRRLGPRLVADGVFNTESEVSRLAQVLEAPPETGGAFSSPDITDLHVRTRELSNWLTSLPGQACRNA